MLNKEVRAIKSYIRKTEYIANTVYDKTTVSESAEYPLDTAFSYLLPSNTKITSLEGSSIEYGLINNNYQSFFECLVVLLNNNTVVWEGLISDKKSVPINVHANVLEVFPLQEGLLRYWYVYIGVHYENTTYTPYDYIVKY